MMIKECLKDTKRVSLKEVAAPKLKMCKFPSASMIILQEVSMELHIT